MNNNISFRQVKEIFLSMPSVALPHRWTIYLAGRLLSHLWYDQAERKWASDAEKKGACCEGPYGC